MPDALIAEPRRLGPLLRLGVWFTERTTGRRMLPARLLAWYPKAALGAGVLESLIAHHEPSPRLLALVRVTASMVANCPFCVDMNSFGTQEAGVDPDELVALRSFLTSPDAAQADQLATLSPRERTAVAYARAISSTPLSFGDDLRRDLTDQFSEREIVILATTAAQVNFWARTIQALGIPAAGFCALPDAPQR